MISIKLQSNVTIITLWHRCSLVILLHICRIPFNRNTSRWLLLKKDIHMEAPGKKSPRENCARKSTYLKYAPRKIAPTHPPRKITPRKNALKEIAPRTITPRKIVLLVFSCFWHYLTVVPFKLFYSN